MIKGGFEEEQVLVKDSHGRHSAVLSAERTLFGVAPDVVGAPDFVAIQNSDDFRGLRRRQRRFVFPVSALFMMWYLTFVLLAAYAHSIMAIKLLGLINVGIVLGLLQFVSTVVIMLLYCRYARRALDPASLRLRTNSGVESSGALS